MRRTPNKQNPNKNGTGAWVLCGLRPDVEPGYGLFVERSVGPIDNPARPNAAAPFPCTQHKLRMKLKTNACRSSLLLTKQTGPNLVPNLNPFSRRVPCLCMVTFAHTYSSRLSKPTVVDTVCVPTRLFPSSDPADYATLCADFLHYYSQMKLSQNLFSVTAPCSWA